MLINRIFRSDRTIAGHSARIVGISLLVPLIFIVGLLCFEYAHVYTENAENTMDVSASLVTDMLNTRFDSVNTVTMAPYYSSYFATSSEALDPSGEGYISRLNNLQDELRTLFDLTTFSDTDIEDLAVITDGTLLYHQLYNQLNYSKLTAGYADSDWYKHALERNGRIAFTGSSVLKEKDGTVTCETPTYYVSRQIRDLRHPERISVILLNMDASTMTKQLADMQLINDAFVVISNEKGEIVYTSQSFPGSLTSDILAGNHFSYNRTTWTVSSAEMEDYDLTVHVIYSLKGLHQKLLLFVFTGVFAYILILVIAGIMHRRLTGSIQRSVDPILHTVDDMVADHLDCRCPPLEITEFDRIGSSVNHMAARLDEAIKNEYLLTIQQENMQMYVLRSQIQPHFLNNTIYCFIALNQIGEKQKLNDALYQLTHLLRYVLSHEKNVTLKREIEFLQCYLELQKLRFETRLSYEVKVDPELEDMVIPRLILQPLVENAVIHGMEPSIDPCHLKLEMTKDAENVCLRVIDDGAGFDEQEWAQRQKDAEEARKEYFSSTSQSQTSSGRRPPIGLFYIQERLRLWSEKCSFSLTRRDGHTVSEIIFPLTEVKHESADS